MTFARQVLLIIALVAITWVVVGCSPAAPDESPGAPDGLLTAVWMSPLRPIDPPVSTRGGFVFPALSVDRRFEVVSVAAADGRVRWRAPASPSRVDHGMGLSVQTVEQGRLVLWLAPGRVYREGDVSLVAADAESGVPRWSYGNDRLRVRSAPSVCRGESAVCLVAYRAGAATPRSVVLDAGSGRVLADGPAPFVGEVRRISEQLYAADGVLARVDDTGRVVWHRRVEGAFAAPVDPDFGWSIHLTGGRYVGSLGRRQSSSLAPTARSQVEDLAATAALDAATGRTLWTRPRSSVFCGQFEFDPDAPVVCDSTGETSPDGSHVSGLDVTLAGLDPATGKVRWRARVGTVRGLLGDGDDIVRVDDTTYLLSTSDGIVRVDLGRGVADARGEDTGWCRVDGSVTPADNVDGVNPGDVTQYAIHRWHPCQLGGTTLERPKQTADFPGGTADGVIAYTAPDGTLRAVHTR